MIYTVGPACALTHTLAAVWSLEPFCTGTSSGSSPPQHVLAKDMDSEGATVPPAEATSCGWGWIQKGQTSRPLKPQAAAGDALLRKALHGTFGTLFTLLDPIRFGLP